MEFILDDDFEMNDSYFSMSYWNEDNLEGLPYKVLFHQDHFEQWVLKHDLLIGYAGYNSSQDEPVNISFYQLCNEVDYRDELRKYVILYSRELLNIDKVEKLSLEYTNVLHMYRLLQGAPVADLKSTFLQVHKNHVEEIKEKSEEEKHAIEVYQSLNPPFLPKQANS